MDTVDPSSAATMEAQNAARPPDPGVPAGWEGGTSGGSAGGGVTQPAATPAPAPAGPMQWIKEHLIPIALLVGAVWWLTRKATTKKGA